MSHFIYFISLWKQWVLMGCLFISWVGKGHWKCCAIKTGLNINREQNTIMWMDFFFFIIQSILNKSWVLWGIFLTLKDNVDGSTVYFNIQTTLSKYFTRNRTKWFWLNKVLWCVPCSHLFLYFIVFTTRKKATKKTLNAECVATGIKCTAADLNSPKWEDAIICLVCFVSSW